MCWHAFLLPDDGVLGPFAVTWKQLAIIHSTALAYAYLTMKANAKSFGEVGINLTATLEHMLSLGRA